MRYKTFIFILLFSVPLLAQHSLWQVKGAHNSVYLLGSVHLLSEKEYPLPEAIESAYRHCPNLVFELNLDSSQTPAAQQFVLKQALLPAGKTLQNTISASTFQLVDSLATVLDVPMRQIQLLKPWMAATSLMMVKLQKMGLQPQYGLDQHFFKRAKSDKKSIAGLEKLQQQIGFINQLPLATQQQMIRQMALEFDTIEREFSNIVKAWRTGDMAALNHYLLDSYRSEPGLYKTFIQNRNVNWMRQLQLFLKSNQNYLVVVGVGHIVGPHGLLELLRNSGYKVTQL